MAEDLLRVSDCRWLDTSESLRRGNHGADDTGVASSVDPRPLMSYAGIVRVTRVEACIL